MTIRKVLEDTSTVGRTGRATWIILKRIRDEAGFIVTDTAGYHKDLYAEKARVMIDVHGEGKGSYASGIGSYGPDWQHKYDTPTLSPLCYGNVYLCAISYRRKRFKLIFS